MYRVTKTEPIQWKMTPVGWIEAQFDLPANGWYFAADRSDNLPLCILVEIALQPCGWLAAYAGSTLESDQRLFFRNLGGSAQVIQPIHKDMGTLTMRAAMTNVSRAGGMIIQDFAMEVQKEGKPLYKGTTNFGFFTQQALDLPDKAVTVELPPGTHQWTYRGQITQKNKTVTVETHIKEIHKEKTSFVIKADGILSADGLVIYQMEEFSLKLTAVSGTAGPGANNQAFTGISE